MRCCSLFGCVLFALGLIACDEADPSLPDAEAVADADRAAARAVAEQYLRRFPRGSLRDWAASL